jgi:hypothetical protein
VSNELWAEFRILRCTHCDQLVQATFIRNAKGLCSTFPFSWQINLCFADEGSEIKQRGHDYNEIVLEMRKS